MIENETLLDKNSDTSKKSKASKILTLFLNSHFFSYYLTYVKILQKIFQK